MLAEKDRDITIVDVGCGWCLWLFELKRHLKQHGVNARTVGIDIRDQDILVDKFIHDDIMNVESKPVADAVILSRLPMPRDKNRACKVWEKCIGFMKPDALLYTHALDHVENGVCAFMQRRVRQFFGTNYRPDSTRAMTSDEATSHVQHAVSNLACGCGMVGDEWFGNRHLAVASQARGTNT